MMLSEKELKEYCINLYNRRDLAVPRPKHLECAHWDSYSTRPEDEETAAQNRGRVEATVSFLKNSGLPGKEDAILEIGCGTGPFIPAFGASAKSLTETDLSDQALFRAREAAQSLNFENVAFRQFDITENDPEQEGFSRRFDLVFSSLVPDCYELPAIRKMEAMSRKYCFLQMLLFKKDPLASEILSEAGIRKGVWGVNRTRKFQMLYNILCLEGCCPSVTYYRYSCGGSRKTEEEYLDTILQSLPGFAGTDEEISRLKSVIRKHADAEGGLAPDTHYALGSILWDVRDKNKEAQE